MYNNIIYVLVICGSNCNKLDIRWEIHLHSYVCFMSALHIILSVALTTVGW